MHGEVVGLQSEWWTMAGVHILLNRGERSAWGSAFGRD